MKGDWPARSDKLLVERWPRHPITGAITTITPPSLGHIALGHSALKEIGMTADEYRSLIAELGLNQTTAAKVFSIDDRTSRRWAADGPTSSVGALLITVALNIRGLKAERQKLQKQIDFFKRPGTRIRTNGVDETADWVAQLNEWLAENEQLLRNHPSGLPSQI